MDPAVPARRKRPSVLHRLTGAFRKPDGGRAAPAEWAAFPLIDTAGEVVAGGDLELRVGITAGTVPDVTAGPRGAAAPGEPFELDVQVVAEGFEAPDGWRVRLRVDETSPYPWAVLRLVALPLDSQRPQNPGEPPERGGRSGPGDARAPHPPPDREAARAVVRRIQAVYSVRGQVIGCGAQAVAVLDSPGLLGRDAVPAPVTGTPVRPFPPGGFADITVVITHGDRPGRLWWSYLSPHFVTPDRPEVCDLGTRAPAFGRDLLGQVAAGTGHAGAGLPPRSAAGRRLAPKVPAGFRELLEAVAARISPRPPRILLLSEDPYVPWELAALERPIDPSLPASLDCQAVVGRWSLGGHRPELPPPPVIRGEAAGLRDSLAALHGTLAAYGEPSELIGLTVPGGTGGLLWIGGSEPVSRVVAGQRLEGAPFVLLAGEAAADLAPAFLVAGAGGVAAPLWPVGVEAARELALELHRRCMAGEAPADVLRSLRCAGSAAALAYRFSGHPSAVLTPPHSTA
ncbi:CHAT domain-containing protein [Planomonospora sp. ID67723]|uniref:CHAT domain-containing protein n=1 Tax=Planomonospora sp. ID67723 TaxID=2738134 RepID=UPI0018C3F722|nr:CHAT domain-containing protein [Planomonospora sp. ID67723]MBG0830025.1 CHAT domain-containing protein [Planomonospora sp. ID67723]